MVHVGCHYAIYYKRLNSLDFRETEPFLLKLIILDFHTPIIDIIYQ